MNTRALGKMVVGNILATAAVRFGQREAFYCSSTGRRFSFAQTNRRCNRLAHALGALGLRKGQRVAFVSTNRAEMVEIYFALAKTGLVGIPLNYRLAPAEMIALVRDIGADALLFERRFAPVAAQMRDALPQVRLQLGFGDGDGAAGPEHDYEALLAAADTHEPEVEIDEADPYYFNLTSGTTGLPKCYLISHYNNSALAPMFQAMDVTSQDVMLTAFPMFGRVGICWAAAGLMYGNRNVLANFDPAQALALIASERVTITNLVPTMAAMLLAQPELEGYDLGSLRALVLAGSLLPAPVRRGIAQRLCPRIYEYYGMQESGALVLSTPEDRAQRADSVGKPLLFSEVRVVDDRGRDAAPGESGEIIGRSPGATTAYHDNPEKTAQTFRDGWIHTGDLGRFDEQGYLFINGRLKDMIVTGGQNVHAGEVEEAILGCPGIADCAVVGLPDPLWGESVTAVVVAKPGETVDTDAVIQWCRKSLAGFKTPKRVLVQPDALPRTPTGKVQKFLLVERYGAKANGPADGGA